MQLNALLTPERTLCRAPAAGKSAVLSNCAHFLAESLPGLTAETLLQGLQARERLGSTGLGNGIAIPHCRLKNIDSVIGALITLTEPIDFDAVDGQPVDIIFILLAPERALQEHLQALATLAELLNRADFRQRLRGARSDAELFQAAVEFRGQ